MKRIVTFIGIFLQLSGMAVTCGGFIWFFGQMGPLMTATLVGISMFTLGQLVTRTAR